MTALVLLLSALLVYGISADARLVSVLSCVALLAVVLRGIRREGVTRADPTPRS
jgi:hypothetical protein